MTNCVIQHTLSTRVNEKLFPKNDFLRDIGYETIISLQNTQLHEHSNLIGIGSPLGFPVSEFPNLRAKNKTKYLNDFESYLENKKGRFDFIIPGKGRHNWTESESDQFFL